MTRHNPVGIGLVGLLATVVLWDGWCAFQWYRGAREAQALEFHYQRINNTSVAVNSLVNEAREYAKRNPSIEPILTEYNLKPRPVPPSVPTSASKAALRP